MPAGPARWSRREFWGAAALTAPVYGWVLWHVADDARLTSIVGWSLLAVTCAIALGAVSVELRAAMLGIASSIVITFVGLAVTVVIAVSQCDCIG